MLKSAEGISNFITSNLKEIFKNGGSRRHSMTIDLSIQKNWEAVCNYDQFSEKNYFISRK